MRRGLCSAFQHGAELRPADTRHHPGRAHRAGTDTDLDHVGSGIDEVARAFGGDHVSGDDGRIGGNGAHLFDGPQRSGLMTVRGIDHQHVGTHRQQRLRLGGRVAVDADCDGDPQPAVVVDGGEVDRRAKRALAGDASDQPPRVVDNGRDRQALAAEALVDLVGRRPGFDHHQIAAHHVLQLAEAIETHGVVLGKYPHRRAIVADDHQGAMRPFVDQPECVADGVGAG